ncbi:DUF7282 domain-containing protein [Candidatus Halobonum tyrrellensis]|uniref:PGF-CTERM sorting domain-containing protein n=1 Tax=Candidatus Halobonum tyrrellensis G22 TaxID=1324957 RepID=V4GTM2_9EURY|nr:PGF-CTERM sorting domain-containing protein [Candidatus Halobonum tyrrellensis]ESP88456.1 hypothetical protein K933_08352 [Candidatus Halobonum tyrrellensis G22]
MKDRYIVSAVVLLSALAGAVVAPAVAADTAPAVQAQTADSNASVTYDDQTAADAVVIESATLPDGGFVVVYNESGGRVGTTDALDAGTHENLTVNVSPAFDRDSVSVAEAHRDNDSDGAFDATTDVAYTELGAAISDTSFVTVNDSAASTESPADATTTDGTTAADTADGSATAANDGSATDGATDADTTETTAPGFTAAFAVAALAAVGLLAARR